MQPTLQPVSKPTDLGTSASDFYTTLKVEGSKPAEVLRSGGSSWIDVRDLGEAHARALTRQEASGNRVIISAGAFVWQEWLDIANSLPSAPFSLAKGHPLDGAKPVYAFQYDASKAEKLLHLGNGDAPEGASDWYKLRTKEEVLKDAFKEYTRRGW